MRRLLLALVVSAFLGSTSSAQVKSVAAANQPVSQPSNSTQSAAPNRRARVLGQEPRNSSSKPAPVIAASLQVQAKSDFNNHSETGRTNRSNAPASATDSANVPASPADRSGDTAASLKPNGAHVAANSNGPGSASTAATPTQVYRVGVRDVLDIQLDELASKNSTLFTVLPGGMLEYPLAGGPIPVAGLTTNEIATLLRQRIKIFDNPTVAVTVRDYASHVVTISGFVAAPGTKMLRREAVPLYTVLAEALALPEAARATITRQGRYPMVIDLKDPSLSATLVMPGDFIKVTGPPAGPTEFYFVSGEIKSAGQKPFHAGLTLTQAIIASGGTSGSAGSRIKISRQGADGRLNTEDYNLRKIQAGKTPDPVLQAGDRIEVTNSN